MGFGIGDIVGGVTGMGGGEEGGGGSSIASIISDVFLRTAVIVVGIIFLAGGVFLLGRQNDG